MCLVSGFTNTMYDWLGLMQFQNNRSPEEYMVVLQKIKNRIRCFNSPSDVQRYEEFMCMKDYLDYRIRTQEYEANLAATNGKAKKLWSKYVKAKLEKFDNAEKNRAEQIKWEWSPLFCIFNEWPLSNFPNSPWAHTQDEWAEIEKTFLENVSTEPLSLELECPHIVRAFLVLFRTLHGHTHHLPHPNTCLILEYILNFAVDNEKSVALTNVVHNLATIGWVLFPGIQSLVDNYNNLHSDTIALLGYEPQKQVAVVEKIRAFIGKVPHRVVFDMVRM